MTTLLELKEKLIRFYGKNEIYVKPAIRFVLALFTFLVINNSIGYMKLVSKTPVAVILALVCSMLPVNGLIAIAALVILADLYALSIEVCLVGLLMFAIIYFIYFRFSILFRKKHISLSYTFCTSARCKKTESGFITHIGVSNVLSLGFET